MRDRLAATAAGGTRGRRAAAQPGSCGSRSGERERSGEKEPRVPLPPPRWVTGARLCLASEQVIVSLPL